MTIDWKNIYKLKIANSDDIFQKHEVIKLILLMKLINKYKRNLNFIRIYTEFPTTNKRKCDIYYENIKKKEAYAFEIQKNINKEWLELITEDYKKWSVPFMKTTDLIIIPLNKLSEDIKELNDQLDEYLV